MVTVQPKADKDFSDLQKVWNTGSRDFTCPFFFYQGLYFLLKEGSVTVVVPWAKVSDLLTTQPQETARSVLLYRTPVKRRFPFFVLWLNLNPRENTVYFRTFNDPDLQLVKRRRTPFGNRHKRL